MITWLVIFGGIYLLFLSYTSYIANKENSAIDQQDPKSFAIGGGNINMFLGVLTYSATLFSTFTLMGMPNFFRTHGVGAWIFLGVTDVAMTFIVLFIGLKIHRTFKKEKFYSVGTFLRHKYKSKYAAYIFLLGVFVFLVPYMAIQIKGISSFLEVAAPIKLSEVYWSVVMLSIILTYSSVGGFKAIVYSDAIQGTILLFVVWIISYNCLDFAGGIGNMFQALKVQSPQSVKLLSTPGPKGLLSFQFLFASFIAIIAMPITQPQLTTRLIAMKSEKTLKKMAPSVAFFAIAVILPATFIGMYGAIKFADSTTQEFWFKVLVQEQPEALGALALIGLIAAAMSTTDSQLFALGNEASIFLEKDKNVQSKTKLLILLFTLTSLLFSIFSDNGLVQLARVSFSGTALLAPMILLSLYGREKGSLSLFTPVATLLGLLFFIYTTFINTNIKFIFGLRIDLFLFIVLSLIAIINLIKANRS